MTITNISSSENGGEREEITVHNEENYISSNKVRLNDKWHYDIDTETFLRDLPKVELHVHFDGSFGIELLQTHLESSKDIYNRLPKEAHCPWDDSTIPIRSAIEQCTNVKKLHALCTCRGKRSLHEMIKCFEHFIPIVRGDLHFIETLAYDFVKRQASQNIVYTEVRYSPHLLAEGGDYTGTNEVDAEPVIDAITKGLRRGEMEFGVKVNQILCCIAWRPDWAHDVINLAHARRDNHPCAIVGVDIAAGEEHFDKETSHFPKVNYPQLDHEDAFQKAKDLNLNITIHAGEVGTTEFIERAVKDYGASRIGHGYRIILDEGLMDEMKNRGIHFEACPTSSLETGGWDFKEDVGKDWKTHPAVKMFNHGLSVGLNSDDPAVFDTSLTWQYRIAVGKMGLTKDCVCKSILNSIDAAYIEDEQKESIRKVLNDYISFIDTA
jgi:adenosine deaminase